uniref:Pex N-terminal domain-containing protein n=1 Tax=Romanomermis culicivorax TaxID=13658 RepID=A0A915K8W0_ROMCU
MNVLNELSGLSLRFGASYYPELFRHMTKCFDEYYFGFELLLQNYFLKNYSASFSENFYGLKRVLVRSRANICLLKSRIRSLCFLVVIPYIKSKLDKYFDKLNEDHDRLRKTVRSYYIPTGIKRSILKSFLRLYPKLCTCFEIWALILQVGYLIHKTDTHSPWIYMAGVILRTTSGAEFQPPSASKIELSHMLVRYGVNFSDGSAKCLEWHYCTFNFWTGGKATNERRMFRSHCLFPMHLTT